MEAPKLPINMAIMEGTPAGVGHTPYRHAHSNGEAVASATRGGRTTADGMATHGAECAPVHQLFVRVDTGRTMTFCVQSWHVRVRDIRTKIRERVHARPIGSDWYLRASSWSAVAAPWQSMA